jgi:hypothetical protein
MNENENVIDGHDESGSTGNDRLHELLADRRAVALVGGAALAVILLIAFVLVPALTGSSGSKPLAARPVTGDSSTASSTATPTPTPSALPTAATLLSVRDPFMPLAGGIDAAANSGSGSGASSTASATASSGSSAVAQTGDATSLRQLTLVEITGAKTAKVTVNGLAYDVSLNTPFGTGFAMTAETAGNATFLYNGQTKTLVPGEYAFFS